MSIKRALRGNGTRIVNPHIVLNADARTTGVVKEHRLKHGAEHAELVLAAGTEALIRLVKHRVIHTGRQRDGLGKNHFLQCGKLEKSEM